MKNVRAKRWAGIVLSAVMAVSLLAAAQVPAGVRSGKSAGAPAGARTAGAGRAAAVRAKLRRTSRRQASAAHTAKARYLVSKQVNYYRGEDAWVWNWEENHTYDKKGNETYYVYDYMNWIGEDENGEAIYEESRFERFTEFDKKYNVTRCTELEDGEETYRAEYKYNKKNQETEAKYYEKGEFTERSTHTYKNGRLSVCRWYDSDNKLKEKNVYTYDKKGHVTKITRRDGKGKVTETVTIKNTYKGKTLKKSVEKGAGYTVTCTYFGNGNMKTEKYRSEEENYTNRYYESGILKSEEYTAGELYELRKYNEDETYIYYLYKIGDYSDEITYTNGYPETEVVTDGEDTNTYTFGYKKSKGRVKRQTRYYEEEPVEKTEFEYVKIKG